MLRALLALCLLLGFLQTAAALEHSPSAQALAGITLLSDSVADSYLSPAHRISGVSCYYQMPYSMGEIPFYGIATGFEKQWLYLAAGSLYLNHPDYQWHNPYLNLAFCYQKLVLGAALHLDYSQVADAEPLYLCSASYAANYRWRNATIELKAHKPNTTERELSISLAQRLFDGGGIGICLVQEKGDTRYLKVAAGAKINEYLKLYGSWQSDPARFGAGINCNLAQWSVLYSLRSHPRLSADQAFALEYSW